jgi:hypothetical protein
LDEVAALGAQKQGKTPQLRAKILQRIYQMTQESMTCDELTKTTLPSLYQQSQNNTLEKFDRGFAWKKNEYLLAKHNTLESRYLFISFDPLSPTKAPQEST